MDSPLLKPYPGLMVWTLVTFFIAMYVLRKYAFGPIQEALDKRTKSINDMIDGAESTRDEARTLLEEQRKELAESRAEAEKIIGRARTAGDELSDRMKREADEHKREQLETTRKQVQAEVEKAMDSLRAELAVMTAETVEKVTRGALDSGSHQQLIEQAVGELDLDRLHKIGASS